MSHIIIKIFSCDGSGMVRRRKVNTSSVTLTQVQEIANLQSNAKLTWKDEDGDSILVETQSDLQEAIACAVTQKSSLRLFVDNVKTSSTPTIPSEPTGEQRTPAQPPFNVRKNAQSLLDCGRHRLLSAINRARSAFDTSTTLQAIKEDACSIRAVFEARVERNLGAIPIVPITNFAIHAVLLWAIVNPTLCLLFKIAIGAILMPRNALSNKTCKRVPFLLAMLGARVATMLLFAFFGFTCCVLPKLLFFCGFMCGVLRIIRGKKRCGSRRRCHGHRKLFRKDRHNVSHASQEQTSQEQSSQEQTDIGLLCKIFPKLHYQYLRQEYMRHKDVQKTVLELLK